MIVRLIWGNENDRESLCSFDDAVSFDIVDNKANGGESKMIEARFTNSRDNHQTVLLFSKSEAELFADSLHKSSDDIPEAETSTETTPEEE